MSSLVSLFPFDVLTDFRLVKSGLRDFMMMIWLLWMCWWLQVDKRYNQYYHQMEALASSFEIVAGLGSAKPYTSVALNRISRHFRALRDAIKEQIQIIRDKLGEKGGESLDEQQGERIPRLRYLDQRLRQQRALHQQLGMVRPAWRPQRGLPENSVSVLRAWLFEHFLHPYVFLLS